MLQGLLDYPAELAGLVLAPSGIGTMASMLVVGRLVGRVDTRFLLAAGFAITAFSLWQMIHYDLNLTKWQIVWPGVIQGVGLGLVFVPLSAAAFATLPREMRADGTAIFSLLRNIGSAVGISAAQALLVRNTQVAHLGLVEKLGAGHLDVPNSALANAFNLANPAGATALNDEITRQAAMIAYLDNFLVMLVLSVVVIPLLFFMRPAQQPPAGTEHIAVE
jgi:DHA2 family multidrug resistance protein